MHVSRRSSQDGPSRKADKQQHNYLGQHHLGEEDASRLPRPVACESEGERAAVRQNRVMGIRLGVVLSDLRSQSRIRNRDIKVEAQAFRTKNKKYIDHHNGVMNRILRTQSSRRPSTAPPSKLYSKDVLRDTTDCTKQSEISRPSTVMFSNKRSVYVSDSGSDSDSITEDNDSDNRDSQSDDGTQSSAKSLENTLQRKLRCHSHNVGKKRTDKSDEILERRAKSAGAFLESIMSVDATAKSKPKNQKCFYAIDFTREHTTYKPGSVLIFDRAKTAKAMKTQLRFEAKQRSLYKPPPKFDFKAAIQSEKEKFEIASQDVKVFNELLDRTRKISLYRKNYLSRYLKDDELW